MTHSDSRLSTRIYTTKKSYEHRLIYKCGQCGIDFIRVKTEAYCTPECSKQHKIGMGSKLSLLTFKPIEEFLIHRYNISADDICIGDGIRKEWFLYNPIKHSVYFYDFTIKSKKYN